MAEAARQRPCLAQAGPPPDRAYHRPDSHPTAIDATSAIAQSQQRFSLTSAIAARFTTGSDRPVARNPSDLRRNRWFRPRPTGRLKKSGPPGASGGPNGGARAGDERTHNCASATQDRAGTHKGPPQRLCVRLEPKASLFADAGKKTQQYSLVSCPLQAPPRIAAHGGAAAHAQR